MGWEWGWAGRSLGQRPQQHTARITPGPQLKQFEAHGVFWLFVPLLFLYGFKEDKHKDSSPNAAVCAVHLCSLSF